MEPACAPQIALRPSSLPPPGPAGTGVSSWSSWSPPTAAATTCVRPTTAAASTLTSSASGQVLQEFTSLCSPLPFFFFFLASKHFPLLLPVLVVQL